MREAVFSIRHRGCWSTAIARRFPKVTASLVSWVTFPMLTEEKMGRWSALWKFEAMDEEEMGRFLAYFSKLKMIEKEEVLYREKNIAIIHEVSHAVGSVSRTIALSECHVVGTMSVGNGMEHWHVIAEKASQINDLLTSLEKLGTVFIERIGKYEPARKKFKLTEKQRGALSLALSSGYYSWPRKVTLEELAQLAGISRRAFQERLRKGEAKAIPPSLKQII